VTLWESRTSPDFFYKKGRFHERPFFIFSGKYLVATSGNEF